MLEFYPQFAIIYLRLKTNFNPTPKKFCLKGNKVTPEKKHLTKFYGQAERRDGCFEVYCTCVTKNNLCNVAPP